MQWFQLIISLSGVIGLILFMFFFLKKLNKDGRPIGLPAGNQLRVIDRVILSRETVLSVVSVAGKLMLIGTGGGRVEKICDLDFTEEEYFSHEIPASHNSVSFSDILRELSVNFKTKKGNKTTPPDLEITPLDSINPKGEE